MMINLKCCCGSAFDADQVQNTSQHIDNLAKNWLDRHDDCIPEHWKNSTITITPITDDQKERMIKEWKSSPRPIEPLKTDVEADESQFDNVMTCGTCNKPISLEDQAANNYRWSVEGVNFHNTEACDRPLPEVEPSEPETIEGG